LLLVNKLGDTEQVQIFC